MFNYKKGMTTSTTIAIVAVVLVIGGIAFFNTQPEEEIMMDEGKKMAEEGEKMMDEGEDMMNEGEAMMEEAGHNGEAMISNAVVLAGSSSKLMEF